MITQKDIDKLLDEIDRLAKDVDHFEFGLPSYERSRIRMYEAIQKWFNTQHKKEQKKEKK